MLPAVNPLLTSQRYLLRIRNARARNGGSHVEIPYCNDFHQRHGLCKPFRICNLVHVIMADLVQAYRANPNVNTRYRLQAALDKVPLARYALGLRDLAFVIANDFKI